LSSRLLGARAFVTAALLLTLSLAGDAAGGPAESRPPRFRFADVTRLRGVVQNEPRRGWGSAWGDYDMDFDSDLFVGRHLVPPLLFSNADGFFQEVTDEPDVYERFDRHACAWGEANGDGRPDLYCASGAQSGRGMGPNRLFIQTPSGFKDRAEQYGVQDEFARGRTVNWIDYDGDGDLDIFVGNKHRDGNPNVMFRQTGDRFARAMAGVGAGFSTISSSWSDWDRDRDPDLLVLRYDGRGVAYENVAGRFRRIRLRHVTNHAWKSGAWGDFNGDGWPDLHVINQRRSIILRNKRGRFQPVHNSSLRRGRMSAWLDVDNDMDLDLFVVQGAEGRREDARNLPDFLINRGKRGFKKVLGASFRGPYRGDGDAVATADFDSDGSIDVFVTNGFGKTAGLGVLLRNRSRAGNWSELRLLGGAQNPWGLGTNVRVRTSQRTYWRQVTDGFNYRAQSDASVVHLGLGRQGSAAVRIEWPGGLRDCVRVEAGSVRVVPVGSSPCP
jgi:hypothetical protein